MVKDASEFGKQLAHWDGVDLNVDARLARAASCRVASAPARRRPTTATSSTTCRSCWRGQSAGFCHFETPYLAQYKALASYTLPYGIRLSGTFQSIPGPQIAANTIYNNGNRDLTLARPFTLGQANVNLVQPGTLYGDRLNQFDLRFTKIVSVGRGRVDLNVDLYNAFNSDAVIVENNTFGAAWQRPITVIQPRFLKLSARWDF